ncbi:hypothetical protein [Paraburkholderia aromaticivorans]|uniref:Uncharacterized protein n=1 Tax=Paraburkholderia aromaticivorans TaxID=2026199 RepID=A0A248W118_9BURK|nr:hypothetical protein [Paraburkholderia aromaticivorans]ASW04402.1 hypothetical protein CJU94_40370 [Paraburkholderia aromaticivorans]
MKAAKGVDDLAARLTSAAATPLVAPVAAPAPAPAVTTPAETPAKRERKAVAKKDAAKKEATDTMQLTLRPTRALYGRYVAAAADRSRQEGRVVSVQEIMLEILEKGAV